jgi:hypothetical protein
MSDILMRFILFDRIFHDKKRVTTFGGYLSIFLSWDPLNQS